MSASLLSKIAGEGGIKNLAGSCSIQRSKVAPESQHQLGAKAENKAVIALPKETSTSQLECSSSGLDINWSLFWPSHHTQPTALSCTKP